MFLDKMYKAKMQWLQDPNQSNADHIDNVRREASGHSREKKGIYES
jgi:hypothetical protein